LLVGTDGVEKMGKSLGNYVAIREPAEEQFGKLMSIPDGVVGLYAELCTTLHPRDVSGLRSDVEAGGGAANRAKRRMAREIVTLYHGAAAAAAAEQRFDAVFKRGEVQQDAPVFALPADDPAHVPVLLVAAGLAASTSEARRALKDGAVKLDGTRLDALDLPRADLVGRVITVGKRRAAKLV
jgi:tyrosyl-tRNA synthetase